MGEGVTADNNKNEKGVFPMDKDKAILLLEQLDRFVDKNPSMFEYDGTDWFDFANALDMAIDCLKKCDA